MVYEAGLLTVLRTILIIAGIYYGLRILVRFLFPYLVKRFINKQQEKFNNSRAGYSSTGSTSDSPKKKSDNKDKLGDYVDYEEVE